MKFFAVFALVASVSADAGFPLAASYGYAGHPVAAGYAGHPVAAGYAGHPVAAVAQTAQFAYGAPITALNAGPLTPGPVASGPAYAAAPVAAVAPVAAAAPVAAYAAAPVAAAPIAAAAPVAAYAAAPVAAPIAGPVSSQYQARDEAGNIAYGYQNINSAKQETGNAYTGVTGSYSYVDEAGSHTVNYVADALGFRASGDNFPINTAVAPVYAAAPVVDTPAVAQAKAAFFATYEAEAAKHIVRRQAVQPLAAVHPVAAAPARRALLTRIQLNPNHAVFYRVF